jgi:hypothetical protein
MGEKSEELARRLEATVQEVVAVIEKLSDEDWSKVTEPEKWTVGVTGHHLAGALGAVAGMIAALATGRSQDAFPAARLDEMNASHAREFARCTKAETLALLKQGGATTAAVLRGLTDDQLARSGTVFTDAPPMTVEQLVDLGLFGHIKEHLGSIRKAAGP